MTATLERPAYSAPELLDPPVGPPQRSRAARFLHGSPDDPRWARPGLLVLLFATCVLYTWNLAASGYANSFYAAAVQAGSQSWKAMFFGSLDAGNSITVDKPPASLWVMDLSARIFGFNSWSLLVPQALEGVAAVGLLYGTVRRISGHGAGLFAGAALALTPAAVLMFRFDNPDALLTLLLVGGAYAVTRSLEAASARWLMIAGSLVGFAFLTKMLQGFLVLPAFALVYLVAAPTSLRRRLAHVGLATVSLIVSAGWWVAIVSAWPASSRPYIGGSTNNSVLNLVLGYNGLSRIFGSSGGAGGRGGTASGGGSTTAAAGSSFGGATGLNRLFSSEMGNEISWLLPAAVVALIAGVWITRRAARTDRVRAALIVWGGWLLVTGLTFSYMSGIIHPYYTVVLAPAIAALVAIGGRELWRQRASVAGRFGLVSMTVAAGGWSYELLARTSSWHPELRYLVLAATVVTVAGILIPTGRVARAVVVTGLTAGLLGTSAFALATAASAHTGSIPSVGPAAAQTSGGMGGGAGSGGAPTGGRTGGGGPGGTGSTSTSSTSTSSTTDSSSASSISSTGGSGDAATTSTALVKALKATTTTWSAAVVGDQSAAQLELDSGTSVISIGGWSGTDASPTLAQFKAYVAAGKIAYFIVGGNSAGGGGQGGSSGVSSQITAWVEANYTSTTVGGTTVYVLTK